MTESVWHPFGTLDAALKMVRGHLCRNCADGQRLTIDVENRGPFKRVVARHTDGATQIASIHWQTLPGEALYACVYPVERTANQSVLT